MRRRARSSAGRGGLWYLLGTAVLCVGAVASAWLLSFDVPRSLSDLDPAPVAVTAPVGEASAKYSMDATLEVRFVPVDPLIAPTQSGTVTSIEMTPGAVLGNGSPLYSVDDHQVTAYVGEGVFFRPLSKGDKGEDVAQAQATLNALLPEWAVVVDGDFGAWTEVLVKKWEERLGVAKPSGVFSQDWFVRLPGEVYTVAQVMIQAGQPVPPAGESLATGLPAPTSATIAPADEVDAPLGAYVFTFEGRTADVTLTDDGWSVSDIEQAVDVTGRPAEGETASVEGNLRLAEPESGLAVPASALMSDDTKTCVAVEEPGDSEFTKVPVTIVEGLVDGTVVVEGDITAGDPVLLNPGEMLDSIQCP